MCRAPDSAAARWRVWGWPSTSRRRCGGCSRQRGLLPGARWRRAELLDLVALGTVADVVPFDINNRILVAQGMRRIRAGRCVPGISALLEVARRERSSQIAASDLGLRVAPRLNAAGRLTDMSIGIRCLLADDAPRRAALALELDQLNSERRQIEARMQAMALAAVRCCAIQRSGMRALRRVPVSMRAGTRAWSAWSRAASRIGCAGR